MYPLNFTLAICYKQYLGDVEHLLKDQGMSGVGKIIVPNEVFGEIVQWEVAKPLIVLLFQTWKCIITRFDLYGLINQNRTRHELVVHGPKWAGYKQSCTPITNWSNTVVTLVPQLINTHIENSHFFHLLYVLPPQVLRWYI